MQTNRNDFPVLFWSWVSKSCGLSSSSSSSSSSWILVHAGSPSRGGDVAVYVPNINQPNLLTLFFFFFGCCYLLLCVLLSLWPFQFQLYFIPYILPTVLSFFTLFFRSSFCLIGPFNNVYLYWSLLECVRDPARLPCTATRVSGRRDSEDRGTHWLYSIGSSTSLWSGFLLDGWLGWPDPISRLVVLNPYSIRR